MTRQLRFFLSFLITFIVGCASISPRIVPIEEALNNKAALLDLCADNNSGACALGGQETKSVHMLPIMQSVTSNKQSRLVIVAPVGSELKYFVTGPGGIKKLAAETVKQAGSMEQVDHLEIFDLRLDATYELVVMDANGQLWDRRKFKALDLNKKHARFILTSCMDDSLTSVQLKMWNDVMALEPDAVVMIGDTAYIDLVNGSERSVKDPLQIWQRHAETRQNLELFKAKTLIPVLATWDDHDFGKGDGDRTFMFKEQAASAFFAFFDQQKPAPGFERGPGVSSWWTAFGVQFALTDDRTFRSPNNLDLADQTHLGEDQELWLKEGLSAATTPVLVAGGDQFFGGYHTFESFEGSHPKNFKAQLARWRKTTARPIVFLSGDRHLTEIIKVPKENLGYATFEITSSAIHAKVYPDAFTKTPSPLQLVGRAGEYNFSLIEVVEASPKKLQLDVKAYGLDKKLLYQQTLMVKR